MLPAQPAAGQTGRRFPVQTPLTAARPKARDEADPQTFHRFKKLPAEREAWVEVAGGRQGAAALGVSGRRNPVTRVHPTARGGREPRGADAARRRSPKPWAQESSGRQAASLQLDRGVRLVFFLNTIHFATESIGYSKL